MRLTFESAKELLPLLIGIGFAVGAFSGLFGTGGGFLIVPGLVFATGMPLTSAIGTSLVAVSAFGDVRLMRHQHDGKARFMI